LLAVTVTPGMPALDSSVTLPTRLADCADCAHALGTRPNANRTTADTKIIERTRTIALSFFSKFNPMSSVSRRFSRDVSVHTALLAGVSNRRTVHELHLEKLLARGDLHRRFLSDLTIDD